MKRIRFGGVSRDPFTLIECIDDLRLSLIELGRVMLRLLLRKRT